MSIYPSAADLDSSARDLIPGSYPDRGHAVTSSPSNGPGYPQHCDYSPGGKQYPLDTVTEQPFSEKGARNLPHNMQRVYSPGLEYLEAVDQVLIHQKMELLEALSGCETKNTFDIKNSLGQQIFTAKEDADCCSRNCFGPMRPFDMMIRDNADDEVIHLYRHCRCDSCFFPCCLQKMDVMAPPGNVIGSIAQEWSLMLPSFSVQNAEEETVLRIEGPLCTCSCCSDVEFKVTSEDGGKEVGSIRKQWSGLAREMFTDADHFGITFPMDFDVNMKALLLGACLLIDVMYFEKSQN